jgi:hypothetical protein
MFVQNITPNPNISCSPGWCLEYVRRAYGLGVVNPTAISAWQASKTQHRDQNFPAGVWVPLWFSVAGVPAGHVVLRAPDGSIYSTSDNTNTAHHHKDLSDLMGYYAKYGKPLTYLGWTEDVQGTPVVHPVPDPVRQPPTVLLTVTAPVAMVRTHPAAYSAPAPAYPSGIARGAKIAAVGYVQGADPYPNDGKTDDAWIKTVSGYYIWANNLGNTLAGLAKLN